MTRSLLACAFLTSAWAWAAKPDADEAKYLDRAKALVEAYLADKGAEYGVDLKPDQNTWTVRRPYPELILDAVVTSTPHSFVGADDLVTAGCREVTVELPARAARARFFVVRELSREPSTPAGYRLVGSCRTLKDPTPRMRLEPMSTTARRFAKREFAGRAAPLVQNYLVMTGAGGLVDWTTLRVRRGRPWLIELFTSPADDCRALEVTVNGSRTRVYVSVTTDESHFVPDVPLALQSLFKDPASLRTYRFALVRGCGEADQRRPPVL